MTDSTAGQATAIGQRPGKRERLVAAATQLLHQQGIERTTLADIASAADVPVGNVYYYFKTKDDVVAAVIEAHAQQIKTTLALIDAHHRSPKSRLKAFVREFTAQSEMVNSSSGHWAAMTHTILPSICWPPTRAARCWPTPCEIPTSSPGRRYAWTAGSTRCDRAARPAAGHIRHRLGALAT